MNLNIVKKARIFQGPHTIAGIPGTLAKKLREAGYNSICVVYEDGGNKQIYDKNHYTSNKNFISKHILIPFFVFVCSMFKYDIFHFYFGRSFFIFNLDLPILWLLRKKMIMTYCGSDVRLIRGVEEKRNPYWGLLKIKRDDPRLDWLKKITMLWQGIWVHKFLAPRNIYDSAKKCIPSGKLEKNIWVHNIGSKPQEGSIANSNEVLQLVHAPSEKGIKGTEYIEAAIEKLKADGLRFEYRRIEKTNNIEARKIYASSDIIIDQVLLGGFGSLAVEGMWLGKPVVGYIIESVREEHYPDCPVYNVNIDNIYERLKRLIEDKSLRDDLGRKGRSFCEKHFDDEKIEQQIIDLYEELMEK